MLVKLLQKMRYLKQNNLKKLVPKIKVKVVSYFFPKKFFLSFCFPLFFWCMNFMYFLFWTFWGFILFWYSYFSFCFYSIIFLIFVVHETALGAFAATFVLTFHISLVFCQKIDMAHVDVFNKKFLTNVWIFYVHWIDMNIFCPLFWSTFVLFLSDLASLR